MPSRPRNLPDRNSDGPALARPAAHRGEPGPAFWAWLEEAMAARAITQEQLATLSGIPRSSIHYWRMGPRVPMLEQCRPLARALGVPLLVLLYEAGYVDAGDLALVVHPLTGQEHVVQASDPAGAEGALPVPAVAAEPDAIARAKLAITAALPGDEHGAWQLIAILEMQAAAARMRAELIARTRAEDDRASSDES